MPLLMLGACRQGECPQRRCGDFPQARYSAMMPGATGDTVYYTNGTTTLPLRVATRFFDTGGVETAPKQPLGCAFSHTCLIPGAWVVHNDEGLTGTSFVDSAISLSLYITADSSNPVQDEVEVSMSAGLTRLALYPQLGTPGRDSIAGPLRLGTATYDRVVVYTADTLTSGLPHYRIWRLYVANPGGIVAFEDRLTRTRFWRR